MKEKSKSKSKFQLVSANFRFRAEWKKVTSRAERSWKSFSSSYGSDSSLIYGLIPPMAGRNRVNCSQPWISEIDCRQKYALRCYLWRWRSGDGRQWQRQQQWQNTKQNIFPPLILRANLSEQVELKHAKQVRRPLDTGHFFHISLAQSLVF